MTRSARAGAHRNARAQPGETAAGLTGEAVNTAGAAARRGLGTILVRVRRVPRRQRARRAAARAEAIRVPNLSHVGRGPRGPVAAREPAHERAVRRGAG